MINSSSQRSASARPQLVQVVDHQHRRLFQRAGPPALLDGASPRKLGDGLSGATKPSPRAAREHVGHRSQKRCASVPAARPPPTPLARGPGVSTHDHSSTDLPLPGGAQRRTTRLAGPLTIALTAPRDARGARSGTALARGRAGPRRGPHCDPSQAEYLRRAPWAQRPAEMGARRPDRLGPPRRYWARCGSAPDVGHLPARRLAWAVPRR